MKESNHKVVLKDEKSTAFSKLNARLARNRTTARIRRERKKQQAETLSKTVQDLSKVLGELQSIYEKLPEKDQVKVDTLLKQRGPAPLACEFCERVYTSEVDLAHHINREHSSDVKAREQFFKQEKQVSAMQNIGELVAPAAKLQLSMEERRRRRLERNALSARLCRQRKKRHIESLRVKIPKLKHNVESLFYALPIVGVPVSSLPKNKIASIESSLSRVAKFHTPMSNNGQSDASSNESVSPSFHPSSPSSTSGMSNGVMGHLSPSLPYTGVPEDMALSLQNGTPLNQKSIPNAMDSPMVFNSAAMQQFLAQQYPSNFVLPGLNNYFLSQGLQNNVLLNNKHVVVPQQTALDNLNKIRCADPDVITAAMALFECARVVAPQ